MQDSNMLEKAITCYTDKRGITCYIYGQEGYNVLYGQEGYNVLYGQEGYNVLYRQEGYNVLYGQEDTCTFICKSSELDVSKCSSSSRGNTLAPATALACSGVCFPICPRAQHTAACRGWSQGVGSGGGMVSVQCHMTHKNMVLCLLCQGHGQLNHTL